MSCDSAYINLATNNVEAFGNILITQPGGTQVQSNYLLYTGNSRTALLSGNVSLTDGKNNLWSEELTYNLGSKIGTYVRGGTLQSEHTTLSSTRGMYNAATKDSRFTKNVIVTDPDYNVTSEDLGYNTDRKFVTFYAPSVVDNDKSRLVTSSGTWDAKNEIANLESRSSITNAAQHIEADTLRYNRVTGFAIARGKVEATDSQQHTTLFSGLATYNERTHRLYATVAPVLRHITSNDSLFIAADTFYSAHLARPFPTLLVDSFAAVQTADTTADLARALPPPVSIRPKKGRPAPSIAKAAPAADTNSRSPNSDVPDTTMPRFYTGYHHVLVFSDSLQARCDSIAYSGLDSTMRLMADPVAWSRQSQISGDTILLLLDSNKISKMLVPDRAFIIARSGPPKAKFFDQIQGKTLTGYFTNNVIDRMVVFPDAETIYYARDDAGAYLGVNQAEAERMKVYFLDGQIRRILFEQDVKQTMTPLTDLSQGALKLSRYQWRYDERPLSRDELFKPKAAEVKD